MSDNKQGDKPPKQKRYLVEIRGVLHINAPDGETAYNAALAWIEAASSDEKPPQNEAETHEPNASEKTFVRVGWLRPFPE